MIEYRFVCIDTEGTWRDVRYASLADDRAAKRFGCALLCEYAAVLIYAGARKLLTLAQIG